MAFLSNLLIAQPTGLWPSIINIFGNVGNYAWAIILLTIAKAQSKKRKRKSKN